jgi:hypothetical protein
VPAEQHTGRDEDTAEGERAEVDAEKHGTAYPGPGLLRGLTSPRPARRQRRALAGADP